MTKNQETPLGKCPLCNSTDVIAARKAVKKLSGLLNFVTYRATCPCCEQIQECVDGCTFEEDCPDAHADMVEARAVLKD